MAHIDLLQPKAFLGVLQSKCLSNALPDPEEWSFIRAHMTCRAMKRYIHGGIIRTMAEMETVRIEKVRLIYVNGELMLFHFP